MKKSIFLLFTLFSAIYGLSCPSGFKLMNQKCLKIFTKKVKHLEAENNCLTLGGTLVTVKDALDNRAVSTLAASSGANSVWLGMYCFSTVEGTPVCYHDDNSGPLVYKNFATGNPNVDKNGGCVYMQVNGASAGQWVSGPCAVLGLAFVCEAPMTENDSSCQHNYNGYCYSTSEEMGLSPTTFDQAQRFCQSNGANLVSLHSQTEISFVKSIYSLSGIQKIFIGAKSTLPELFDWADASDYNYDYTDPLSKTSGNCLSMDLSSRPDSGMWAESNCGEVNSFMCKRRIGGSDSVENVKMEKVRDINPKFKKATERLDFSNCNATIIISPSTITTFDYPSVTAPLTYCTWNIAALGPYRVAAYFTHFSPFGNVAFYDESGNNFNNLKGFQQPFSVLGTSNLIRITHDNNDDVHYRYPGFEATILPY